MKEKGIANTIIIAIILGVIIIIGGIYVFYYSQPKQPIKQQTKLQITTKDDVLKAMEQGVICKVENDNGTAYIYNYKNKDNIIIYLEAQLNKENMLKNLKNNESMIYQYIPQNYHFVIVEDSLNNSIKEFYMDSNFGKLFVFFTLSMMISAIQSYNQSTNINEQELINQFISYQPSKEYIKMNATLMQSNNIVNNMENNNQLINITNPEDFNKYCKIDSSAVQIVNQHYNEAKTNSYSTQEFVQELESKILG